jgi:preprotein translocase subunit Sec63
MTELLNDMSTTEFGVIILGFLVGFSVVSFLLSRNKDKQTSRSIGTLNTQDWSTVLGVSASATETEIRDAYRRQLSECEAARYLGDSSKMSVSAAIKKIPLLHQAYEEAIKQRKWENA